MQTVTDRTSQQSRVISHVWMELCGDGDDLVKQLPGGLTGGLVLLRGIGGHDTHMMFT